MVGKRSSTMKQRTRISLSWTQAGVSLVECCTAMAIASALVATGTAQWGSQVSLKELEARAAETETDLQWLRTEAVMRNQALRIRFQQGEAGACYVIHAGPSASCSCTPDGQAYCEDDGQALKTVGFATSRGVRMRANVASVTLDPRLGTASPGGSVLLSSQQGATVRHVISLMGRVRSCADGGNLGRYPKC
jgi:type IV fimbrial biogenesis protein FimT